MATLNLKTIQKEIALFTTNRDKLRDHAHVVAMMIFQHAAPKEVSADCNGTGDCTEGLNLVSALPGSWGTQMIAWFKKFTPIRINAKNGKCEYDPAYKELDAAEKLKWWNIEGANTTPFHAATEEAPAKDDTFDDAVFLKMISAAISKRDKAVKDGKIRPGSEATVDSMVAIARAVFAVKPSADNTNTEKKEEAAA